MTPKLYLILHKARGEPAWDIAEPAMFGDGPGWTVCTSGHRAYPYDKWPLISLMPSIHQAYWPNSGWTINKPDWTSLPDHYAVNDRVRTAKPSDLSPEDVGL